MLRISWVVPVPPDCQSVQSLRVRIESALPVSRARTLPGIAFTLKIVARPKSLSYQIGLFWGTKSLRSGVRAQVTGSSIYFT